MRNPLPPLTSRRELLLRLGLWVAASALVRPMRPWAQAVPGVALSRFELLRTQDDIQIGYTLSLMLGPAVQQALHKGLPLHFVAQAELLRQRWYFTDQRLASVSRQWRLSFQPLLRNYRLSLGGFAQSFDTLDEALKPMLRVSGWRVIERSEAGDERGLELRFSFELDTTAMPRPMQIGIQGQAEWSLRVDKRQVLP